MSATVRCSISRYTYVLDQLFFTLDLFANTLENLELHQMLSNYKRSVYVIQFRLFDERPRNTRKFNIAERLFIKEKVGLVARYLIYAKGYAFMFNDERANIVSYDIKKPLMA